MRRLLALVLAMAMVAAHAVAAPQPMPRADAFLLEPAAVCHAATDDADAAQPHATHCFLLCQMAQATVVAAMPAAVGRPAAASSALRPPVGAAPAPRACLSRANPRGPPALA